MDQSGDGEAEQEYKELQADEFRDPDEPNSFPSGDTVKADRADAVAEHAADRPPTPEEERLAEQQTLDPEVAASYEAALERGADVEGEGQITP
ncbi:MAG: hypothetical protein Q8K58_12290 [Acidimicrobiales bacterium]|nr:hypothetical protein [Acidimicrobiales bacterium]